MFFWTGQLPSFYDRNPDEDSDDDVDNEEEEEVDVVDAKDKNDLRGIAEKYLPKGLGEEETKIQSKVKGYSVIARMFKTSVASLQKVSNPSQSNLH